MPCRGRCAGGGSREGVHAEAQRREGIWPRGGWRGRRGVADWWQEGGRVGSGPPFASYAPLRDYLATVGVVWGVSILSGWESDGLSLLST